MRQVTVRVSGLDGFRVGETRCRLPCTPEHALTKALNVMGIGGSGVNLGTGPKPGSLNLHNSLIRRP